MSVVVKALFIDSMSVQTNASGGTFLNTHFTVVTSLVEAGDTLDIYLGWKNKAGSGDINYIYKSTAHFDMSISGEFNSSFRAKFDLDTLACGETFSFWLKTGAIASSQYDLLIPSRFSLPFASYMIAQRPTMLHQLVYYNGVCQGEAGDCVACAIASTKEVQEMRSGRGIIRNSLSWYFGATATGEDGAVYADSFDFLVENGMLPYHKLQSAGHIEQYPDSAFYYDRNGFAGARSIYQSNQNFLLSKPQKIKNWKRLTAGGFANFGWQSVLDALQRSSGSSSSCVIMALGVDAAFDASNATGYVPDSYGKFRAGHAVLVLGWKTYQNRLYWVVQNSWGSGAGDNGIYYIPFSNTYSGQFDSYTTGIYDFYELVDDPNAPIPDRISPWSWEASNGDASPAQTQLALNALNGTAPGVHNFSHIVWNDLVDKILEMRTAKNLGWYTGNNEFLTYARTKMTASDRQMTAARFNSARRQISSVVQTSTPIVSSGQPVAGAYFTMLTGGLNDAIDTI